MRSQRPDAPSGKTIVVVVLSLVLVLLAVAAVWLWPRAPALPTSDEGRQVAEQFLNEIRVGRASQAWDSTTAEFKSALGREKFLLEVKRHPFLAKPLEFVEIQTVSVQQVARPEALFRAAQGKATVRLLAGDERGTWRIDRMTVDNSSGKSGAQTRR